MQIPDKGAQYLTDVGNQEYFVPIRRQIVQLCWRLITPNKMAISFIRSGRVPGGGPRRNFTLPYFGHHAILGRCAGKGKGKGAYTWCSASS